MSRYINTYNSSKRSFSEDNKHDAIIESIFRNCQKENAILKEIISRKIKINGNLIVKRIVSRKSNSFKKKHISLKLLDDDEKIKFDEWIICNNEKHEIIEKEFLQLLLEIFNKRYNIYPNNICALSPFAVQCKKNIEIFCKEFYELSFYVLYVLNEQFVPFFQCIDEQIHFKNIKQNVYENIREILHYLAKDIQKIFKGAIGEQNFNFSNILIFILEDYLIKSKIKEERKIKNIPLLKEKQKFDNYIKNIYNLNFRKNYDICFDKNLFEEKDNEKCYINNDNNNKMINNTNTNTNSLKIEKNDERNNNNNSTQNLNIDDLIEYINQPKDNSNNKKKKKKKKKKTKKIENTVNNENDENIADLNEDLVYLNYKKSLEEFSQNITNTNKIKPNYSEKFLNYLSLINN